jgi:hypothetical protein
LAIPINGDYSISSCSQVFPKQNFSCSLFDFDFIRQGYFFEHEITDEIAPKYHQYIRRPIALDTIRKLLESNEYPTKEYFRRDIYLMLYNAMKYNPRHHHVHRSAKHLFNITRPLFHVTIFTYFTSFFLFILSLISYQHKKFMDK